jgi:hypothetical protein
VVALVQIDRLKAQLDTAATATATAALDVKVIQAQLDAVNLGASGPAHTGEPRGGGRLTAQLAGERRARDLLRPATTPAGPSTSEQRGWRPV